MFKKKTITIHFHLNVRVFNHFLTPEKLLYYSKLGRGTRQGFMRIRLSICRTNMKLDSCMRQWKHLEREHQEVGKWDQHMEGKRAAPPAPVCDVLSGISCHATSSLFFKGGSTATSERNQGSETWATFRWVAALERVSDLQICVFSQWPTFKNFISWWGPASQHLFLCFSGSARGHCDISCSITIAVTGCVQWVIKISRKCSENVGYAILFVNNVHYFQAK